MEIGCGYGRDTKVLLDRGHFVVAYDKSIVGIALAEERLENHIKRDKAKIVNSDFLKAQPQDNYFDAVISHRTLHLIDPSKVIEVIERITASLKQGGTLVLSARSPADFNKQQMKWVNTKRENDNMVAVYKHRENHVINFYDEARLTVLLSDRFIDLTFINGEEIEAYSNIDPDGQCNMSQYIMVVATKK